MITVNEEMLIREMQTLRFSLNAKQRVQTEMHPSEKNKIYTLTESLEELERYYVEKRDRKEEEQ